MDSHSKKAQELKSNLSRENDETSQFLRSEIIDDKTCLFCLTADERVVTADDPITNLAAFHESCRGIWIPILASDDQLSLNPIPKSIMDNINTLGGKPVINGFANIKEAVPTSIRAKEQVKKNGGGETNEL